MQCGHHDEYDLIRCDICGTCFHGSCENPPLTWIPTKAFCSPGCFERYQSAAEGKRVFSEFHMLGSGYLRRIDSGLEPEQLPTAQHDYRAGLREEPLVIESCPVDVSDSGWAVAYGC